MTYERFVVVVVVPIHQHTHTHTLNGGNGMRHELRLHSLIVKMIFIQSHVSIIGFAYMITLTGISFSFFWFKCSMNR